MAKSRKVKGLPNYLQLTKAAASKRVSKPLNKENGAAAHHPLKKTAPSRGYRGPLMVQPTC
ncbi:hypothetical protein GBAR_LOCUS30558 [Geodia barretti]|uniref:Uncharacterized protein n=2 Tax=Geodia barretti TaxID=519541 RepID=A0AA35XL25_GEOBA|nr:hypothetical protein GBAR_LOCUS30558 [Geodia barretti]